ncbi:hypothetical protein C0992_003707 [Termitomyces sp. T32_za158]|nr:hypothetical protein C0992_003707 [Termitomyces sp. T32_za158]
MEALLQWLEAAKQLVPPTASFLQDDFAVMVMEGLLNQIELMRRQHIAMLEQIECTAKRKLSPQEGVSGKLRWLKLFPSRSELVAPSGASSSVPMLAQPTTMSTLTAAIRPVLPTIALVLSATSGVVAAEPLQVPAAPMMELSLDQQDEEMNEVPLFRKELKFMDYFESMALSAGKKVGPQTFQHGQKAAQLLFMKEVVFPAPPTKLTVVKLTTDSCTPAQYNGLMATVAAGKGKQRAVPAIEDDSDYG